MVASPKLSKYFYEYEARTGRVHARHDNPARSPSSPGPVRRRGMPAGTSRKRLSDEQRQAIIELLKATPNVAAVARKFAEATHVTVSQVTVGSIKREAIILLSHKIRHHVFIWVSNRKMWYFGLSSSGSGDRNGRRIE
jgi:hypothetical protein